MAASLVQSVTGSSAGGANLVLSLNGVNAANTLVLMLSANLAWSSGLAAFSVANAPAVYGAAVVIGGIYYNSAPSAGTNTVTLTNVAAVVYGGGCLMEWSGLTASPLDLAPAASNITAGSTAGSNSIASGTPAQANEVVFALVTAGTSGAGSANIGLTDPPTGFTSLYAQQNSSVNQCWEMSYKIISSIGAVTPSWTWTDTTTIDSQAVLASLKATSTTVYTPFSQTQFFAKRKVTQR